MPVYSTVFNAGMGTLKENYGLGYRVLLTGRRMEFVGCGVYSGI